MGLPENHHKFGLRYLWLLLKVYFLRVMSYIDVYATNSLRPKPRDDVRVERIRFPSRDKGRYLSAYVFTPVDLPEKGPHPVHMNAHGSGFISNAYQRNSQWFCYLVASKLKCIVVDTDYRKGPEYPFPFPQEDVEDCYCWIASQPERFDLDMVTAGGFSAGGNLVFSACATIGPGKIKAIVSYYAPIDASTPGARIGVRDHPDTEFRSGVLLIPWIFNSFFVSYVPDHQDPREPSISVYYQPVDRWPDHMLLVAGTADSLYQDSLDLVTKVKEQGTPAQAAGTRFISVPNEAHAFDEQPKCPESVKWRDYVYDESVEVLRTAHNEVRRARGQLE
ncbi:hypothetical protein MSPP1_002781 [Malassezia sp. CBS 17886]|nr:hypothetical protein MSPP1_002781 [Malassezia sp. CBS 17886]